MSEEDASCRGMTRRRANRPSAAGRSGHSRQSRHTSDHRHIIGSHQSSPIPPLNIGGPSGLFGADMRPHPGPASIGMFRGSATYHDQRRNEDFHSSRLVDCVNSAPLVGRSETRNLMDCCPRMLRCTTYSSKVTISCHVTTDQPTANAGPMCCSYVYSNQSRNHHASAIDVPRMPGLPIYSHLSSLPLSRDNSSSDQRLKALGKLACLARRKHSGN